MSLFSLCSAHFILTCGSGANWANLARTINARSVLFSCFLSHHRLYPLWETAAITYLGSLVCTRPMVMLAHLVLSSLSLWVSDVQQAASPFNKSGCDHLFPVFKCDMHKVAVFTTRVIRRRIQIWMCFTLILRPAGRQICLNAKWITVLFWRSMEILRHFV